MKHPSEEVLLRFAEAKSSPSENREIVRHLLHGCDECGQKIWSAHEPVICETDYESAIRRLAEAARDSKMQRRRPQGVPLPPRVLGH